MLGLNELFVCPICKQKITSEKDAYNCVPCKRIYPVIHGIPIFMTADAESDFMNTFWDKGWENRLEKTDQRYLLKEDCQTLSDRLSESILALRDENDTIAEIMPQGNEVLLNIGCGTGEASLFTVMGFNAYIGLDFSYNAAQYSQTLIRKLGGEGITAQANAELLPIATNSIDIVYSNGVLHHTPETVKAIGEAIRVLKPGGRGVIGLYNTWSPTFVNFRLYGAVKSLFKTGHSPWYAEGEGAWKTGTLTNPWTKTYSAGELKTIFSRYAVKDLILRKAGFSWGNVLPKIGKHIDKTRLGHRVARRLYALFGAMWVITFKKEVAPKHLQEG